MTRFQTHVSIASAAAMLALTSFASAPTAFAADKVTACYGVNSCKGMSDCKSASHECKGMNSCKGQGFKDLTAKECAEQHGSQTQK